MIKIKHKITGKVLKIIKSGKWEDLSNLDLKEADLRGMDFSGSDFSNTNLSNSDLRGADLSKCTLIKTNLREADLREADLSESNLSKADLSKANLRFADLMSSKIEEARKKAKIEDGINKINSNLNKSFFGTINEALKNGYEKDKHYVIVDWVFFHSLINQTDKIFSELTGNNSPTEKNANLNLSIAKQGQTGCLPADADNYKCFKDESVFSGSPNHTAEIGVRIPSKLEGTSAVSNSSVSSKGKDTANSQEKKALTINTSSLGSSSEEEICSCGHTKEEHFESCSDKEGCFHYDEDCDCKCKKFTRRKAKHEK